MFDPGIGTGRIAVPLAERGYRITGIDLSRGMLAVLKRRLGERHQPLPISFQRADAAAAPFRDAAFDLAIVVHFFHLVPNWRGAATEALRVVRKEGPLVIAWTGQGTQIPSLRARYKEVCAERGSPVKQAGVQSTDELLAYFQSVGCRTEWARDRWRWTTRVRYEAALDQMSRRVYAFTNIVPDDVHRSAVEALRSEFHDRLTTEAEVPNEVRFVFVSR